MASKGSAAYGTKFQTNATGSFVTIAEVTSIGGPGRSTKKIDVSNMDSPGAVEEFVLGMINSGEVELGLNFLPNDTTQKQVNTDFDARTLRSFKIIWSNAD